MLMITKANGKREPFSSNKVIQSLRRSGVSKKIAESIASQVKKDIRNNESTSEIYKKAFKLLKQIGANISLARYSLKKAILQLGPTGYPLEHFIARLFEAQNYKTKVGKIFNGRCVSHEIDVYAKKGKEKVLAEVKFRNRPGDSIPVGVPLYMHSRFKDILAKKNQAEMQNIRCMIITNARYSKDAIKYSRCSGDMELIGWRYPKNKGLERIVEESGLHPITVLDSLSNKQRIILLKDEIVVCRDIKKNFNKLKEIGLSERKIKKIKEQVNALCSL